MMSTDRHADLGSTAAIGCHSVWLGLLLAVSSRRTLTVQFDVEDAATGTTIVTLGSRSGQGALPWVASHLRDSPKA